MSVEKKLKEATGLIDAKKYDEARRVLEKINHPAVKPLLVTLNQIAPPTRKRKRNWISYVLLGLVGACGCSFVISVFSPDNMARVSLTQTARVIAQVEISTDVASMTNTRSLETISTSLPSSTPTIRPTTSIIPTRAVTPTSPPPTESVMLPTPTFEPSPAIVVIDQATYYVRRGANLRSCPERNCEAVVQVLEGTRLEVDAYVTGEAVENGNPIWYRVIYRGQSLYIYSSLVTTTPPRPTEIPALQISTPVLGFTGQQSSGSPYTCNGSDDLSCDDFSSSRSATAHLLQCGTDEDKLDQNNNGVACESN
jgi:hypothetical protein